MLIMFGSSTVALWAPSCGNGNPIDRDRPTRRTEIIVEDAPSGLEQSVQLDSSRWQPRAFLPDSEGGWEIEGIYFLRFHNQADQALDLRYELRFLDADEFLLDVFIPFGQPLRLVARSTQDGIGEFVIRARGQVQEVQPVVLQVAVRVSLPK